MRTIIGASVRGAPVLPFLNSVGRVSLFQAIALALPLVVDLTNRGPLLVPVFITALAVALFWENLFAFLRHTDLSLHGLTTAMLVTLFVPIEVAAWQVALAVTLGVVLGELVFGGRGFGFIQPAAASLAMLAFSFPQLSLHALELPVAFAVLPAVLLLFAAGLLSWRVLVASSAILSLALAAAGVLSSPYPLLLPILASLILLITDPLSAASTNPGRWLYGALCGFLVALFAGFSLEGLSTETVVFAAVLGSVFAPLIDHLVVLADASWRERHHRRRHHG